MSTTIRGGAYLDAKGNWFDANGKPLSAEVIAQLTGQPEAVKPLEEKPVEEAAPIPVQVAKPRTQTAAE